MIVFIIRWLRGAPAAAVVAVGLAAAVAIAIHFVAHEVTSVLVAVRVETAFEMAATFSVAVTADHFVFVAAAVASFLPLECALLLQQLVVVVLSVQYWPLTNDMRFCYNLNHFHVGEPSCLVHKYQS